MSEDTPNDILELITVEMARDNDRAPEDTNVAQLLLATREGHDVTVRSLEDCQLVNRLCAFGVNFRVDVSPEYRLEVLKGL